MMTGNVSCKINLKGVIANVSDENGNPSELYGELLAYYEGDQDQAIEAWSNVYTQEYEDIVGLTDSQSSTEDVLRFMTDYPQVTAPMLDLQSLQDLSNTMSFMGVTSLDGLTKELTRLFKPNGVFEVNADRLFKSGLYSLEEIDTLSLPQIKGFLDKLEATNANVELYNIDARPTVKIKDTLGEKTLLGTYKTVSENEIVEYIVRNSPSLSMDDIDTTLDNSEYASITDRSTRSRLYNQAKGLRALPKVYFDGRDFTSDNLETFTTMRNVAMVNVDPLELLADIEFLEDIPPEVWDDNKATVRRVLGGIEKSVIKYNVDLVGVSQIENREDVLSMLKMTADMLSEPSRENIMAFATLKDMFITVNENSVIKPENGLNAAYSIQYFESDMTPSDVFERTGMLKVGDNLYHATNLDTQAAYDYLYTQTVEGTIGIPTGYITDLGNEENVRDGIKNYINTRETGFNPSNADTHERISLAQVLFKHPALKQNTLPPAIENQASLKTDFIGEFYRFILEEKQKGSDLYDKILSKFSVGDGDLNFNSLSLPDITGMRYEKELREYAALKKEGQIKEFALPITEINGDIYYLNNPSKAMEIPNGTFIVHDAENIVTKNVGKTFVSFNGVLFRRVIEDLMGNGLFRKVNLSLDNIYFDANPDFSTDISEAERVLRGYSGEIQVPVEYNSREVGEAVKMGRSTPTEGGRVINQDFQTAAENDIEVERKYETSQETEIKDSYDECR